MVSGPRGTPEPTPFHMGGGPSQTESKSFLDKVVSKASSAMSNLFNVGNSSKVTNAKHPPADNSGKAAAYEKSTFSMLKSFFTGKPSHTVKLSNEQKLEKQKENWKDLVDGFKADLANTLIRDPQRREAQAYDTARNSLPNNPEELAAFKKEHPDFMKELDNLGKKITDQQNAGKTYTSAFNPESKVTYPEKEV